MSFRERWLPALLALGILPFGLQACAMSQSGTSNPEGRPPPSSGVPRLPSGPAIWQQAVPSTRLGRERTTQGGLLLSSRWFGPDGRLQSSTPDGSPIHWPAAMAIRWPATVRINTTSIPTEVDVRLFSGDVDAAGVPRTPAHPVLCSRATAAPSTASSRCQIARDRSGVEVVVTGPPRISIIVVYAEWYVPVADRSPDGRSDPVVSASWGFRVA